MVKAKLYRQNHTQKHSIHTHKKRKREKIYTYIYIVSPKVHLLNLGWFVVCSGIPQMQGTSSWLWRFNPLLLRLLGEISLSLLCSYSSWGSALDLSPPLHVGPLRAFVFRSDRTGLKEQWIRGLWLTQARGRGEGYGCGVSLWRQRPPWRCTSVRCAVLSPREVVPGSWDPGSGGLHRLPGGEVWRVPYACTQGKRYFKQGIFHSHSTESYRRRKSARVFKSLLITQINNV